MAITPVSYQIPTKLIKKHFKHDSAVSPSSNEGPLGCISKGVVSRSREIIIPIHLRGVRSCLKITPQLQHGQKKAPTVEGRAQCTRRRLGELGLLNREDQGGV